jgi:hypothetical protein
MLLKDIHQVQVTQSLTDAHHWQLPLLQPLQWLNVEIDHGGAMRGIFVYRWSVSHTT